MLDLIICDTSVLILFEKINKLDVLKQLYSKIYITPEIALEFGNTLPGWIEVKEVKNKALQKTLSQALGIGESSAIAMSLELQNSLVAIDDLKARRIAISLEIKITGSLGILIKAKEKGYIKQLKPMLKKIEKTDFRISENIIKLILKIVKE